MNFLGYKPDFFRISLALSYREDLIETQLIISIISLIVYMVLYMFKPSAHLKIRFDNPTRLYINIKLLYILMFPVAFYLVYQYPWPEHGDEISFGNSLAAYAKNVLLVLLIMLFVYQPRYSFIFLLSYVLLIAVDTQRTPLLVVFIAYLLLSNESKFYRNLTISFLGIFMISYIALYRNDVPLNFINLTYPFFNEGVFGSYVFLQSLEVVKNYDYYFYDYVLLIISPFFDLLVKLIPGAFFDAFDLYKNDIYILSSYISTFNRSGYLAESWTPMGGFFYMGESNLMIPYLGPVIFTAILYFIARSINYLKKPEVQVLLYSCLFLFIKANMFIAMKYILFLLICYAIILLINKLYFILIYSHFSWRLV